MSRFYITTPIYYINAEPHLGHAYTTLVADAVARAHRLSGDEVFFLTGTDEHGQKVERAAQKAGKPTKVFADEVAQKFVDLLPLLNASNDDFIRTSEPRHYKASQEMWRRVKERGHIYKGKYEGWYCTVDEVFIPETQLQNGRCPTCGNAVEKISEESYFFKLSAFQDRLLKLCRDPLEDGSYFITPTSRRKEVVSFVEAGLEDLSISRTSFKWGIPVPDDPAHVMYVWFDALTNYMTAVGFGDENPQAAERFKKWWPADGHLIGKEIVRQHAVYWPALLMAAELPVPRHIVSHGWWLMEGAKMSKSLGNVVRSHVYIDRFGLDAFRYFVFREMTFGQDASFTDETFVGRYNADLANDLGNLVSRATTMIHRYCGGVVPAADSALMARAPEAELMQLVDRLIGRAAGVPSVVQQNVYDFQLSVALREIWDLLGAANRYIVTRAPWVLAKDASKRAELDTALYVGADVVRVVGELVRPFMPHTGDRILQMVGVAPEAASWKSLKGGELKAGTRLGETVPLFPRIEQTVEELQRMADPSQPSNPGVQPAAAASAATQPVKPATPASAAGTSPAAATPASPIPAAPAGDGKISYDDFMKVELRVAKVLAAERVPKSTKLLKLTVDAGTEQRTIVAGIAEAYEPEAMVGRTVVIAFNLKPAKLMGIESNGMVLAGSPEGGKPQLLTFDDPPPAPGSRVR